MRVQQIRAGPPQQGGVVPKESELRIASMAQQPSALDPHEAGVGFSVVHLK